MYKFTITEEMVRRPLSLGSDLWKLKNALGKLLPQDVGKRVYQVGEIYQVENSQQRDRRLAK